MYIDQSIFDTLRALVEWDGWDALVLLTSAETWYPMLAPRIDVPIISVLPHGEDCQEWHTPLKEGDTVIRLPCAVAGIEDLFNLSVALAMTEGVVSFGDHVIFVGSGKVNEAQFIIFTQINESSFSELHSVIANPAIANPRVLKEALTLALELGQMRKRPPGALYVIGDAENVLANSTQLFMNPFEHQPLDARDITSARVKETLREYASLDGAVVIDGSGVIQAAGVHLNADTRNVDVLVEGTRHAAAAAITQHSAAVAITVSEKTGVVTLFKSGTPILRVGP